MKKYRLNIKLHFSNVLLLSAIIFFAGCKTIPTYLGETLDKSQTLPIEYICPADLTWEPLEEGFEVIRHEMKDFGVRWICVKADLTTPNLKIVATPTPEELGESPKLQHVKTFAKNNNAIVAINATPWKNKSFPHDAVGIVKINGIEYFPPVERYCALCFTENPLKAEIIQYQTKEELEKYIHAFGGFSQVLKDGKVIPFNNNRRSRVSVGVNNSGTELYFFVVSTILNPKDRNGFTFEECGLILQKLGCTDVMHFDGGHSSCIVIQKKESQKPLLNRKIPIAIGLKK